MPNLIRDRIVTPLKQLLNAGLTSRKMAQALAIGFVLGITPMLGISSALAAAVAAVLGLNQVAIQVANWAAYPVQILLFIPFLRAGEWLLNLESASINPIEIASMFSNDFYASLEIYGYAVAGGFAIWAITAVPVSMALAHILKNLLERTLYKETS